MADIERWKNFSELELMIGLWYGEARIVEDSMMEEIREYLAIGNVVLNRIKLGRWGKSPRSVILAPNQFSCFNENDPNVERIYQFLTWKSPSDVYNRLKIYATQLLAGKTRDFSELATHYVARWLYEKPSTLNHSWIPKMKITAIWGGHVFLKEGIE